MSEFIMDDTKYVMLPKHDDLIERKPRGMFGKDLKELLGEEAAQTAYTRGTTVTYKGNEYFIDEAL